MTFRLDIWHTSEEDPARPTYPIERPPDESRRFAAADVATAQDRADAIMQARPREQSALLYRETGAGDESIVSLTGEQ